MNLIWYCVPMETDKTVLIMGASSGIGAGLASYYLGSGFKVIACARRAEQITINMPNVNAFRLDVTDFAQLEDTLNEIVRSTDCIDLIINCIGIGELNTSLDSSLDSSMIETNVKSFTLLSNWAYNFFNKQGHGHYAAISSIAGLRGGKDSLVYNASKAFQINYLEGLQHKAAKESKSIFISDIRPGLVDTAMAKGEGLFWVMPVEKVVKQIAHGIHQKKRVITVTKRWRGLAWFLYLVPKWIYFRL